jgi:hypothetical protein
MVVIGAIGPPGYSDRRVGLVAKPDPRLLFFVLFAPLSHGGYIYPLGTLDWVSNHKIKFEYALGVQLAPHPLRPRDLILGNA